jgi:cytochrome P450
MIFLMMAAHDTTTSTLSSMFYLLGKNPEWQQRLREESQAMNKTELEWDDLEKMRGIDCVMKETLRLLPPLTAMPRTSVKNCEFEGYFVPRKSLIGVCPIHTHHMEEYWTNPEEFDPERFTEQRNEHKKHPFAFVPFGGGAHMCIGQHFADMQVKSVMHQILLKYEWDLQPNYQFRYQMVPIAKPRDGMPVRLKRLQN